MKFCKLLKSAEWTPGFIFEGILKNDTRVTVNLVLVCTAKNNYFSRCTNY